MKSSLGSGSVGAGMYRTPDDQSRPLLQNLNHKFNYLTYMLILLDEGTKMESGFEKFLRLATLYSMLT